MSKNALSIFIAGILCIFLVSFRFTKGNDLKDDVFKYTNEYRESNNLPDLVMEEDLNKIAQKHSENMANGRVAFGHDGFESRAAKIRKKIKESSSVAENVAFGVYTGKDVVELWKTSRGHRLNMLGDFKYIGIGTAIDSKGQVYFT